MKRITLVEVGLNRGYTGHVITKAHLKALGAFITALADEPFSVEMPIGDLRVKIEISDDGADPLQQPARVTR